MNAVLDPRTFPAALALLLASVALALGALGLLAWGATRLERGAQRVGYAAIAVAALVLLALAAYWLTRPFATGAV